MKVNLSLQINLESQNRYALKLHSIRVQEKINEIKKKIVLAKRGKGPKEKEERDKRELTDFGKLQQCP